MNHLEYKIGNIVCHSGKRYHGRMEDYGLVQTYNQSSIIVINDGHGSIPIYDTYFGGYETARFTAHHIASSFFFKQNSQPLFDKIFDDTQEAWKRVHMINPYSRDAFDYNLFQKFQTKLNRTLYNSQIHYNWCEKNYTSDFGCTSCCVSLSPISGISVANCGDTRCYWFRPSTNEFSLCSTDHTVHNVTEVTRMVNHNCFVQGSYFVLPSNQIMISRSFGHLASSQYGITHKPCIKNISHLIQKNDWIVVATDGLWDVFDASTICKFINHSQVNDVSLEILSAFNNYVQTSIQKCDNMCMCCVKFY